MIDSIDIDFCLNVGQANKKTRQKMVCDNSTFELKKHRILECKQVWKSVSEKLSISDRTVTIVLSGENLELDQKAISHLKYYVARKKAVRAEILVCNEVSFEKVTKYPYDFPVNVTLMKKSELQAIYEYYCFAFNMTNITFTFLEYIEYNLLGRIIEETDLTLEEIVDLGVYWLREVIEES